MLALCVLPTFFKGLLGLGLSLFRNHSLRVGVAAGYCSTCRRRATKKNSQNISHLLYKEETDTSSYCSVNVGSKLFGFVWRTVLRAPCIYFREPDNGFHALNSLV
jgi:hypothetical protein